MKEYLSRQSIPFQEIDVSRDREAAAEMVRVSRQRGVPVTVIDGQAVVGYDRPKLEQLLAAARRPHLGAAVADAADMAAEGRCSATEGAYVGRVSPGSLASQAGLLVGDVIVSLANHKVNSAGQLENLLVRLRPGQSIPLTYVRGTERHTALLPF